MDGSFDAIPGTSTQNTPPATPPNPELRRIFGVQYPDADFTRRVGDVCGLSADAMDDRVAGQVADAIRNHLREVLQEARRFAVHGRRMRMIPQDLDDALRLMGVMQPLYGMRSAHGEPFRFAGSAGKELVLTDTGEVDLTAIINAPPPRMPLEPQLKPHWLVIDGVQPAVPENPVPPAPLDLLAGGCAPNPQGGGSGGREERGEASARTLTTHSLSLEQQVFFKEIVDAVIGHDADKRNEALHCLQTDRGLQSMAPRFVLTIVEGVRTNIALRDLHCLQQLLLMTHALMNNRAVTMSRVVHDLLPSVVSCCVARRISARPAIDNHWAVREAAGKLVARMCNMTDAGVLRTRVAHLLMKSFGLGAQRRSSLATLYGAVFGLSELGLETVRTLVVPRAAWLHDECQRAMAKQEEEEEVADGEPVEKKPLRDPAAAVEDDAAQQEEAREAEKMQNDEQKAARKMIELVTSILIKYVRATRPAALRDLSDYTAQLGGFADAVHKETVTDMPSRPAQSSSSSTTSHLPRPMQRMPVSATPRARPAPGFVYGGAGAPPGFRPHAAGQQRQPQYPGQARYM